jgi:sulfopyruvate decarboxylase subunit alpha
MLDGKELAATLRQAGVTHVVWIPDSELGTWDGALSAAEGLSLIRVCREGEAFAVAAGLWLGGKWPVVMIQCTGLFEAGDALRNVIHDMKIPLFLIIGVRSWLALQKGNTWDTCPGFTEPILRAWQIPYRFFNAGNEGAQLGEELQRYRAEGTTRALLLPE